MSRHQCPKCGAGVSFWRVSSARGWDCRGCGAALRLHRGRELVTWLIIAPIAFAIGWYGATVRPLAGPWVMWVVWVAAGGLGGWFHYRQARVVAAK